MLFNIVSLFFAKIKMFPKTNLRMFNFILFSLSFKTASSGCYAITEGLLRRVLRKAILRKQKAS